MTPAEQDILNDKIDRKIHELLDLLVLDQATCIEGEYTSSNIRWRMHIGLAVE